MVQAACTQLPLRLNTYTAVFAANGGRPRSNDTKDLHLLWSSWQKQEVRDGGGIRKQEKLSSKQLNRTIVNKVVSHDWMLLMRNTDVAPRRDSCVGSCSESHAEEQSRRSEALLFIISFSWSHSVFQICFWHQMS